MSSVLGNSKAEDSFNALLKTTYGLEEGPDFIREHTFSRTFHDTKGDTFRTRVDFWFPQWRVVVEFKAAPLGTKCKDRAHSKGVEYAYKGKYRSIRDTLKFSWSNQREKFRLVTAQANQEEETSDILWILVDDNQMGASAKYTYYDTPQCTWLRKNTTWNPMRQTELGRLMYFFKAVGDLSLTDIYGGMEVTPTLESWFYDYKLLIIKDIPKMDTTHGLYLIEKYGNGIYKDRTDGLLYLVEEIEARQIIAPPLRAKRQTLAPPH